jgi:hypothetical protein
MLDVGVRLTAVVRGDDDRPVAVVDLDTRRHI